MTSLPSEIALAPRSGAPRRRVVETIHVDGQYRDRLECGHYETGTYSAKRRLCRSCANPAAAPPPTVDAKPDVPLAPVAPVSPPEILTVDEAAAILRVNRKTLYELASRGEIPGARRVGRILRLSRRVLIDWIEGAGSDDRNRSRRR